VVDEARPRPRRALRPLGVRGLIVVSVLTTRAFGGGGVGQGARGRAVFFVAWTRSDPVRRRGHHFTLPPQCDPCVWVLPPADPAKPSLRTGELGHPVLRVR
jgi:hypothetical protein